jgi:AbiJ N-terminal domain 3/Abortive infection C-terminus
VSGAATNAIPRRTRKNLFDLLALENVYWFGRLDDVEFLRRVFELTDLPSEDGRFHDAEGDVWQHRVNNSDWPDDWIFTDRRFDLLGCPDELFLRFIAEIVHPVVRPSTEQAQSLVDAFNEMLRPHGYELVVTEKVGKYPVWSAARITTHGGESLISIQAAHATFNAEYIGRQITRMEGAIENDPGLAIGTAKELVESTLRSILEARSIIPEPAADLAKLMRLAGKELNLVPDTVSDAAKAADSIRKVLGALGVVVQGMAELRNAYGSGHGHSASPAGLGLDTRNSRLEQPRLCPSFCGKRTPNWQQRLW